MWQQAGFRGIAGHATMWWIFMDSSPYLTDPGLSIAAVEAGPGAAACLPLRCVEGGARE
jgi:hypothetical protein